MSIVSKLSASSYETFKNCPKRFYLEKVEKRPRKPAGWQAQVGTVVHDVLENLYALPVEERTPEKAKELMVASWDAYRESSDYMFLEIPDLQFKHAVFAAVTIVPEMEEGHEYEVVSLERELVTEVEGVPVVGYVDRVISYGGWVVINDWKSGRPPKPADYNKKLFQPLLYASMFRSLGERVDEVELIYLQDGSRLGCVVTDEALAVNNGKLRAVWDDINSSEQQWLPKPGPLCNWCDFANKDDCPEGLVAADNYRQYRARNGNPL